MNEIDEDDGELRSIIMEAYAQGFVPHYGSSCGAADDERNRPYNRLEPSPVTKENGGDEDFEIPDDCPF